MQRFKTLYLTEKDQQSRGERAKKTSKLGPAIEHMMKRHINHALNKVRGGMSINDATHHMLHGSPGSKGPEGRERPSKIIKSQELKNQKAKEAGLPAPAQHPLYDAIKKLPVNEFRRTAIESRHVAHAVMDHMAKHGGIQNIMHAGADNSGAYAAKIMGGPSKADVIAQKATHKGKAVNPSDWTKSVGLSLKFSTADKKSSGVKINNPGGQVLPKAIDDIYSRAFPGKKSGLADAFSSAKGSIKDQRAAVISKHSKALSDIFKTDSGYRRANGPVAKFTPEKNHLNDSARSYLKRIKESDPTTGKWNDAVHPNHRNAKTHAAAKAFIEAHDSTGKQDSSALVGKMHNVVKQVLKAGGKHADDMVRTIAGIPENSASTHLVSIKRGGGTDRNPHHPTVEFHDMVGAMNRHISSVHTSGQGHSSRHTPGTNGFSVGPFSVGWDRGTWNVQAKKEFLGAPLSKYDHENPPAAPHPPKGKK